MNLTYTLTQYTDHRELELQYVKVKDENQQLKMKISTVEELYRNNESKYYRRIEQKKKEILKMKQKLELYQENIQSIYSSMGKRKFDDSMKILEDIKGEVKVGIELRQKMRELEEKLVSQNGKKEKELTFREENFAQKISDLQQHLSNIESIKSQLQIQNQNLHHHNHSLNQEVNSYKELLNRRVTTPEKPKEPECQIEDNSFTVDVLSYEKECLVRVFTTMTNGVQNADIKHCMEKIYGAYVDVVQCWREKLQLEYDLEDLECEYKRERMGNEENILIELRKEIETFRKELHHQKECLCQKNDFLQHRIQDFQLEQNNLNRMEKMALKFNNRKQKAKQEWEAQQIRTSVQSTYQPAKSNEVESADDIVKRAIEKDRQNLERILYETRAKFK